MAVTPATKYGRRACLTVISEEMSLGFLGGEEKNPVASLHEPADACNYSCTERKQRGRKGGKGLDPRPKRSPLFDEMLVERGIAIG